MVPDEITFDIRLKHLDVRVYSVLSSARRESRATLGCRRIAELVHSSKPSVLDSMDRLRQCGHIRLERETKKGHRPIWILTSKWFNPAEESESKPQKQATAICPRCNKTKRLTQMGACHGCKAYLDIETRARAARRLLGEDASVEEIAKHLHLDKVSSFLLRVLRKIEHAA